MHCIAERRKCTSHAFNYQTKHLARQKKQTEQTLLPRAYMRSVLGSSVADMAGLNAAQLEAWDRTSSILTCWCASCHHTNRFVFLAHLFNSHIFNTEERVVQVEEASEAGLAHHDSRISKHTTLVIFKRTEICYSCGLQIYFALTNSD